MDISMTVLGSLFIIQIKPLYSASLSLHSKKKMQSATAFFNACDTGKGWAECAQYCTPNATFDCQTVDQFPVPGQPPTSELKTVEAYTQWMQAVVGLGVGGPTGFYIVNGSILYVV